MLAYLDALCAALVSRRSGEILRLLEHPLGRVLPRQVREEALVIAQAAPQSLVAPVHALHFYHQTMHLLGTRTDPATRAPQFELPLRAAGGS